jgi:hypothetical protein
MQPSVVRRLTLYGNEITLVKNNSVAAPRSIIQRFCYLGEKFGFQIEVCCQLQVAVSA